MTTLQEILWTGPASAPVTLLLAHGAGAPMDTPFMNFFADGLAARGVRVGRFEFAYMAQRRVTGLRRPPDNTAKLQAVWRGVITACGAARPVIGGKSMGGRMASMLADEVNARGLVCLGYPLYGAGRKDKPRTAHLVGLRTPTLICQGERDAMGDRSSVEALALSQNITLHWAADGDHDLKPRKASGRTHDDNLKGALDAVLSFLSALPP